MLSNPYKKPRTMTNPYNKRRKPQSTKPQNKGVLSESRGNNLHPEETQFQNDGDITFLEDLFQLREEKFQKEKKGHHKNNNSNHVGELAPRVGDVSSPEPGISVEGHHEKTESPKKTETPGNVVVPPPIPDTTIVPHTNPKKTVIRNPYAVKSRIIDPSVVTAKFKTIPLAPESPSYSDRVGDRDADFHPEVVKFTRLANKVLGSTENITDAICPVCLFQDNPTTDRYLTGKFWHPFGTTHRCRDHCYGCGVHCDVCETGGNDYKCRQCIFDHDGKLHDKLVDRTCTYVPIVCKGCLRPCNSNGECVSIRVCWKSNNKYFIWRFCMIVRRALLLNQYRPDLTSGVGGIPRYTQVVIVTAVQQMYKDLRYPNESSQFSSPFIHMGTEVEWTKWLVSTCFGPFFNYMVLFRYCFQAIMNLKENTAT